MPFKCAPQIIGLTRSEGKGKHRAPGAKIVKEAGVERASKSDTLDRSRSVNNVFTGFQRGAECWQDMVAYAEEYRVPVKTKKGIRERALRKDAVIGWAMIINPPHEASMDWTPERFQKFYDDAFDAMNEIEPRLFCRENVRMTAIHRDEGITEDDEHIHFIGDSLDEDGKYCGNLIDAKLMIRVNERFPSLMREKGWDLEDLDVTDWERAKTDKEYAKERRQKRKHVGQSVNDYIADTKKRVHREVLQDALESLQSVSDERKVLEADNSALKAQNASLRLSAQKKRREMAKERANLEEMETNLEVTMEVFIESVGSVYDALGLEYPDIEEEYDEVTIDVADEVMDALADDLQQKAEVIERLGSQIAHSQGQIKELKTSFLQLKSEEAKAAAKQLDAIDMRFEELALQYREITGQMPSTNERELG